MCEAVKFQVIPTYTIVDQPNPFAHLFRTSAQTSDWRAILEDHLLGCRDIADSWRYQDSTYSFKIREITHEEMNDFLDELFNIEE